MDWNKFAREVHANAVAHGWWDEPKPSFAAQIALMHSELSEALEEYRAEKPMVYYPCNAGGVCVDDIPNGLHCESRVRTADDSEKYCSARSKKPEGIAVELADCVLRILDTLAAYGQLCEAPSGVVCRREFCETLCHCHEALQAAWFIGCVNGELDRRAVHSLVTCIDHILVWTEGNGVDMEEVLRAKHEYNKTRPRRHGGKKV